jgi:hypothetical protein
MALSNASTRFTSVLANAEAALGMTITTRLTALLLIRVDITTF